MQPSPYFGCTFQPMFKWVCFLEHTSLYHFIWQLSSPCSPNCGNPSFGKYQWIVAEFISHPFILSLVKWWTHDSGLAFIVHFPRIVQRHPVNVLHLFFSSRVWGILTPIRSESRSDIMVGTYFQEFLTLVYISLGKVMSCLAHLAGGPIVIDSFQ